jgi:hypothetical protein
MQETLKYLKILENLRIRRIHSINQAMVDYLLLLWIMRVYF